MADMLTAKDVQDLLQVDRSTVYRMAEAVGLPAIVIPFELREALTDGLREGLWGGDLEMLDGVFRKAQAYTESLLKKLN